MYEYLTSWWQAGGDYTEYVFSATGEVYDSVTGEIVGFYDEVTGDIRDGAGALVDNVSDIVSTVYGDAKTGLASAADLAGQGFTAASNVGTGITRASNLGFLVVLIPTAAIAYWYFLGRR